MKLQISYYRTCILSIHRGMAFGFPSNAKPLFLLAIINCIEEGLIMGNKIEYGGNVKDHYKNLCKQYEPNRKEAPFYKPFFHSSNEEYYSVKWKDGKRPQYKGRTPSAKYIRENIAYAYLDDGLWELLQEEATRAEFKQLIIEHYLA